MKNLYRSVGLAALLGVFCGQAAAQGDEAAEVQNCEDHWSVIDSQMQDPQNLPLADATLKAMESCPEGERDAIAEAGLTAANTLPEAEAVATALREAGVDQTVVDNAMQQYVKLMDQPFIHHDGNIPTGGGDYNPGPIIGGGTRPPVGGTRPPVSPDS